MLLFDQLMDKVQKPPCSLHPFLPEQDLSIPVTCLLVVGVIRMEIHSGLKKYIVQRCFWHLQYLGIMESLQVCCPHPSIDWDHALQRVSSTMEGRILCRKSMTCSKASRAASKLPLIIIGSVLGRSGGLLDFFGSLFWNL